MGAEDVERGFQRRPVRDLLVIVGVLLFAILSVPVLGFHPGTIALFGGIGVAAIPRFVWIERRVAPIVIASRFILSMILVGVVGAAASGAELALMRPAEPSMAVATLTVGFGFVPLGIYGYRSVSRLKAQPRD